MLTRHPHANGLHYGEDWYQIDEMSGGLDIRIAWRKLFRKLHYAFIRTSRLITITKQTWNSVSGQLLIPSKWPILLRRADMAGTND